MNWLQIVGCVYAAISAGTALATCVIMRGRDWNPVAAIGAGMCWPVLLVVALRKPNAVLSGNGEREKHHA